MCDPGGVKHTVTSRDVLSGGADPEPACAAASHQSLSAGCP